MGQLGSQGDEKYAFIAVQTPGPAGVVHSNTKL